MTGITVGVDPHRKVLTASALDLLVDPLQRVGNGYEGFDAAGLAGRSPLAGT